MHTTTAFVKAVKESADILKQNIALIYERDPYGSDSDSAAEHPALPPATSTLPAGDVNRIDSPAVAKEVVVHEAKKVVARDDNDAENSDEEVNSAAAIGNKQFLNFELDDLLNENTAEFNLDLCKVQVARLFSKVRVGERVEAAKDMEQWVDTFLDTFHAESAKLLRETEVAAETALHGLEERRQDIATMVAQTSIKTSTLLKGFMQKVAQYRFDTLEELHARYTRSAYDEFWDGLQGTIDKEASRRRSKIDEQHTAAVAAEVLRRTTGDQPGREPSKTSVNPSVAAAHMLEAISLQQDETTYRKTRLELESAKKRQYENLLATADGTLEDGVEVASAQGPDAVNGRARLSDAEAELFAKARADARKAACESLLASEDGRRLAEKAGGQDFEDQNQLFFDCQKLKLKAKELEKELKATPTPEERIKDLEQQVATKRSQLLRATKRSERRARQRAQEDEPLDDDDKKVPDAASQANWLLSLTPALSARLGQVQEEYRKLKAAVDGAKESFLAEKMESGGYKSVDPAKPKLETLQQKLQESKQELQVLMDEKAVLEEDRSPRKKKAEVQASDGFFDFDDQQVEGTTASIVEGSSFDEHMQSDGQQSCLLNAAGQPLLTGAMPDPADFKSIAQTRPYLAELAKACQMLERQRVALSAQIRIATGAPEEEVEEIQESTSVTAQQTGQKSTLERRGSGVRSVIPKRTDTRQKVSARIVRKGRRPIIGALKPAEDQPEITEEAKAGVLSLLSMFRELEDSRAQIQYADHRIHRAKTQTQDRKGAKDTDESDEIDDGAPDANRDLRREVLRKQRELNQLRKRWAEDRGNREKNVARQAALTGSAVRYLLQDRQQAELLEADSSSDSPTSSSQSRASSKESRYGA
mmetsp:Transcript_24758/g.55941  ORF Transcript_24758/g.55941 Transcript_24758/m.55941 type:complete len:877 (+) Transcript_24758:46-2676(+)